MPSDLDRLRKIRLRNEDTIVASPYPDDLAWLFDLALACVEEREAVCETQSATTDDITQVAAGECVGDNHDDGCVCELKREDRLAILNKLPGLE